MFPERKIEFHGADNSYANIDIESFHRVIDNLIHNALKYSNKKAIIKLEVNQTNGEILTEVKDQGKGIPASEKNKIWDKFYRIGNEETREQPGTGLGLWIAKQIITAHRGQLSVADNKPQGSIFKISLPAAL